jgi:hypothetical protein
MNFLAAFFIEKTEFLSTFFSSPKFERRMYTRHFEEQIEDILFFAHFQGYLHEKSIF